MSSSATALGLTGYHWSLFGAGLAAILAGIGSCIGITIAAKLSAGVLSEEPEKFGGLLVLAALPGTQGIYGFITAIMVVVLFGLLQKTAIPLAVGSRIFIATLPVTINCFVSAIYQGIVSGAGVKAVAKKEDVAGKAIVLPALVETYAVLSLIATIFMLLAVRANI
ncbi:MAG: V-type ATP synthase subunit K [Actinobacteria bacterium]|nr:MAG: V-type ATP synthase subunit K [Actinomycetota bacterium]